MSAKDIILRSIDAKTANELVRRVHYSGKVVNNSQIHIGVFYGGKLEGAMQFGPSLDKRKLQGLVEGTLWNEFIELNRLAFTDNLPRNSESRALAVAMKLLRKHAPQIKWVVTFADGTQCGDGAIYRAAGFVLTSIKVNDQIWSLNGGATDSRTSMTAQGKKGASKQKREILMHTASIRPGIGAIGCAARTGGASSMKVYAEAGFAPLPGFQLRYLYFIDPTARERLTVPILPFSEIERRGAGMYKGEKRAVVVQAVEQAGPPSDGVAERPDRSILLTGQTPVLVRDG